MKFDRTLSASFPPSVNLVYMGLQAWPAAGRLETALWRLAPTDGPWRLAGRSTTMPSNENQHGSHGDLNSVASWGSWHKPPSSAEWWGLRIDRTTKQQQQQQTTEGEYITGGRETSLGAAMTYHQPAACHRFWRGIATGSASASVAPSTDQRQNWRRTVPEWLCPAPRRFTSSEQKESSSMKLIPYSRDTLELLSATVELLAACQ